MHKEKVLNNISKLHSLFLAGKVIGPENHEVNPNLRKGSRENYLYFTLPCCINFQRNSPALWASALKTYDDPDTNYLFFPEQVVKKEEEEIREDMIKHKLALQTNKHPMIWRRINETFYNYYNNDPRKVLSECNYDVVEVIDTVQKKKKNIFPYLGGVKLSNYWLFILNSFTDVEFNNLNEISIIPDTHIIKSTIHLGLAKEGVKPDEVERIWRKVLKEVQLPPTDMHSALWRWSRNNFTPSLK